MNQSFVSKPQNAIKKSSVARALEKVNEKRIYATNDTRTDIAAIPNLFEAKASKVNELVTPDNSRNNSKNQDRVRTQKQDSISSIKDDDYAEFLREEHEEVNGVKTVEEYLFLKG